ncbi:hypothetical protein BJF78_30580 [Pseudonocardia sp. CNS-139]|nr:hypothetical protein BJF78_30580 [Pseudonocardia sp. CNS-139]
MAARRRGGRLARGRRPRRLRRLHEPQFVAVNVAGFSSGVAAKAWLASIAFVLALVQLGTAVSMQRRRRPPAVRPPAWVPVVHRWSGRLAVLVTVPVAVHCLYALGFQGGSPRVLVHSLVACFFYGVFVTKMLLLQRSGGPRWLVPALGGALFTALTAVWLSSSVWFFSRPASPSKGDPCPRTRPSPAGPSWPALRDGLRRRPQRLRQLRARRGAARPAPVNPPAAPGGAPAAAAPVATTADVPVGGGLVLAEQDLVITQPTAGEFKAFSATCTHQAARSTTWPTGRSSARATPAGSPWRTGRSSTARPAARSRSARSPWTATPSLLSDL